MKFALIDVATGRVKQWQDHEQFGYADPVEGEALQELPEDFEAPEGPRWVVAGALVDADPNPPAVNLAGLIASAVVSIDVDADAIRRAVIGERATEYQAAYDDASAYKAAGYAGTVPPSVQSWVDAKKAGGTVWTTKQAADDILTTAAQWTAAQQSIRANRLKAKEQAKVAADANALAAVMTGWAQFVAGIRAQLGV